MVKGAAFPVNMLTRYVLAGGLFLVAAVVAQAVTVDDLVEKVRERPVELSAVAVNGEEARARQAEVERIIAEWREQGDAGVRRLSRLLQDDDVMVRRNAARMLLYLRGVGVTGGRLPIHEAFPVLRLATQDDDKEVRALAIQALAYSGPRASAAVPVLTATLRDSDETIRALCCQALGNMGRAAEVARPELERIAREGQPWERKSAQAALDKINGKSVGATSYSMLETVALLSDDGSVKNSQRVGEILRERGIDAPMIFPLMSQGSPAMITVKASEADAVKARGVLAEAMQREELGVVLIRRTGKDSWEISAEEALEDFRKETP